MYLVIDERERERERERENKYKVVWLEFYNRIELFSLFFDRFDNYYLGILISYLNKKY